MFKKLLKAFKNKNKMNLTDKSLPEIEAELMNSAFQWIKGENLGMVEKFNGVSEDGNSKYVNFKGGGRMNLSIISEFMDIFPSTPVILDSIPTQTQQTNEKIKVNSVVYEGAKISSEESAIYKLLKKQKPNWVNVNISLKLNLPTKSLYDVLITSFEDADSEISNYVTEGIDIEDIKEAISESIKSSFYNLEKTKNKKQNNTDDEFLEN